MFLRALAACFGLWFCSSALSATTLSSSLRADDTVILADGTPISLFGIAKASEFRTDTYIGKLYAPETVERLNDLFRTDVAKRMHLRYVIDNYSNRKIGRHFKERIALNNPREVWQPLTSDIIQFANLFQADFKQGDEIRIDYLPSDGTRVYLNGSEFAQFTKPNFINILLNAWIGSVPLSKNFDAGIKGKIGAEEANELMNEFATLTTVYGRFDELTTEVAETDATTSAASPSRPTASTPRTAPRRTTTTSTPSRGEQSSAQQTRASNRNSASNIAQAQSASSQRQKSESAQKDTPAVGDTDLIRGSFTRELIDKVNAEKFYPPKALRSQEAGEITAKVTIDPLGELVDIEFIDRSGSRTLDRAVSRIIKSAAPYPSIPPELQQETFAFDVTILFEL